MENPIKIDDYVWKHPYITLFSRLSFQHGGRNCVLVELSSEIYKDVVKFWIIYCTFIGMEI